MLTKAELQSLYVQENLSDAAIGRRFGVSDATVSNWRRLLGITTMSAAEKRRVRGEASVLDLTEQQLRKFYLGERLTISEISRIYGCSVHPIKQLLAQYEIPVVAKWERHDLEPDLPASLLPMVTGTLLGDATIGYESGGATARLKIGHSYRQYSYLMHLHDKLGAWARPVQSSVKREGNREFFEYTFSTIHHPTFRRLRILYYRDDLRDQVPVSWLKCPSIEVFKQLSMESLAYWYFDDGTYGDMVSIVVFFPLLDLHEMVGAVREATGLDWYLEKVDAPRHLYRMVLRAVDNEKFFAGILKYATPDLAHKFSPPFRTSIPGIPEVPSNIEVVSVERLVYYESSSWKKLSVDTRDQWVSEVFEIYRQLGFPFPRELSVKESRTQIETLLKQPVHRLKDGYVFKQSNVGTSLCEGFFPHRFGIPVGGESAVKLFHVEGVLKEVIRSQLSSEDGQVTPSHMRKALSTYKGQLRVQLDFRPAVAKAVTDYLCPDDGVVWDFDVGYGGRLLGTLCSSRRVSYRGRTPSCAKPVQSLQHLHQVVCSVLGETSSRMEISDVVEESSVDLVWLSHDSTFCDQRIAFQALRQGGHLVLSGVTQEKVAALAGFVYRCRWVYPLRNKQLPTHSFLFVYSKL